MHHAGETGEIAATGHPSSSQRDICEMIVKATKEHWNMKQLTVADVVCAMHAFAGASGCCIGSVHCPFLKASNSA
jgi:hypothetical protein